MTNISLHNVKRKNSRVWMLRWYDSQGRRCGETIGKVGKMTKRQADYARRDKQGKIDNKLVPLDRPQKMALSEFLRRDREAVEVDIKAKSIEELRTAANHAIRALGGEYDIQQLDYADVGRIKAHLADRGLAAATITKTIRYLQSAFARGVKLRVISVNPFQGVKLPKIQPRAVRTYKLPEIEALIKAAPDIWWESLIQLGHTSGFRLGEMLNLQWADLDFEAGTVKVQAKRAGSFKVGEKTYPIFAWTSKSYHDRTVPIPQETVTVLQRLKAKSGKSRYVFLSLDRLTEIGAFMVSNKGKLPGSYKLVNNITRSWAIIQDAAEARLTKAQDKPYEWEHRTIHDMRRTFGSIAAQYVPAHELQQLMGHANLTTTQRFYLAVGEDMAERVRSAFKFAASA